jgi:hypothetical protein
MGLFDTVKLKANALAADAERAGKVTAAQARTVVLQNDIRKAERELGHSAYSLIESGQVAHPDLDDAAARLRAARQALHDKEAEIAGLRHNETAGDAAAPAPAPEATGSAPAGAAPEAPQPAAVAPPAAEVAASAADGAPTKRRAPAAKKATPKKAAPKKAAAKKPGAGKSSAAAGPVAAEAPPAADA